MKLKIYESFGYAGTDSTYIEEIPEEIVEQGQEAIEKYIEECYEGTWDSMCERLSLSIEVIDEK